MRGRPARRLFAVALLAACSGAGQGDRTLPRYEPHRRDYVAFRDAHPEILEPNYLPFMAHTVPGPGGSGVAVFCRWPDEQMPLAVHIEEPGIPASLQDEFDPENSADYVRAVEKALSMWQRELDGHVGFRRVAAEDEAVLTFRLRAERAPAPDPEVAVLGLTPIGRACESKGRVDDARYDVGFSVPEVTIYLADQHGLLEPDQVGWIALHEVGHALGMRLHSPIPADLMYEVVRDRVRVPELSTQDTNSFLSVYQLENGTVFAQVPAQPRDRPPIGPPTGAPELAMGPFVDARLGFELRTPAGWMRVPTSHGVAAVDGTTWDYGASFQVVVARYDTIEDYLERYQAWYMASREVIDFQFTRVNGYRALRAEFVPYTAARSETLTLLESGDGRVLVVTADCPLSDREAYAPHFEAALATLDIWVSAPRGGAAPEASRAP